MTIPPNILKAPYSEALAQADGWCDVVVELESLLIERGILGTDVDRSVWVTFEFMDGLPKQMGIYTEPAIDVKDYPTRYNSDIYVVIEHSLCPVLAENPMHHAMFRYEANQWQAARLFDANLENWNRWRAAREQCNIDRRRWFNGLAKHQFAEVHELTLFIMIDPETTEQIMVPLLVGVDDELVWMMTSYFSDKVNPRAAELWAESCCCNAEILYRCATAQLGDAVHSYHGLTETLEVAALKQVAEAFYWRYVDGLAALTENPDVAFSKPQRLHTLSEHTSESQALEPNTPFLLTRYAENGLIAMSDGRSLTPALVSIEGALSSRLNPAFSSALKSVTGRLGRAPKAFAGPSDKDLFTLLREEIAAHGDVESDLLRKRMQNFAALELYVDRYLPDDLAPHLDYLYLVEFGADNLQFQKREVKKFPEYEENWYPETVLEPPPLQNLQVYTGLKKLDLRSSSLDDLKWLESVDTLEALLLSDTPVADYSPLENLGALKDLDLSQTNLKVLNPVVGLDNLENLRLHRVQIDDITPLASMKSLKSLDLSSMPISDISCLASLPYLEKVLLAGIDEITDYSVLADLPELKVLSIAQTSINDLSILPDMPKLETLYIWDCFNVKDLAPLSRYKNLKPVNRKGTGVVQS